ncbi:MAG: dynamin family protein [Bryobacterales bacterium]|nr:dynamin family protein [Bryobacterales bacterium]
MSKEHVLGGREARWREAARGQLQALLSLLEKLRASGEDRETVESMLRQLDEMFLLVVVGEFNSGKSAFVNALLGSPVLEEGVVPTTSRIQVLKYGETAGQAPVDDGTLSVWAPAALLEDIHIVDTPGTNAIERRHEAITRQFIPRADLVLFVTSADRPFTESERAFLAGIRDWGKKIVMVVNKIDILETPEELARVDAYVRDNARALLGTVPEVFAVSSRQAFRAKQKGGAAALESSGFESLERYVFGTLDEEERVRLKLLSPLGVGLGVVDRQRNSLEEKAGLLERDVETVDQIEGQSGVYRQDMNRDFRLRLSDTANILHELEARGHAFIEEVVRLPRLGDLLRKEKLKAEFVKQVVGDAPAQIERRVEELIDWLVSSDLQQWRFVTERINRRRSDHSREAVGEMVGAFAYDRQRLAESVGRAAQQTLETYDRHAEAARMAESVQKAVANTALLEVGAVGLGTVVSIAASTTAADFTGLAAAGLLATLGLFVIPQKRRATKKELRDKIARLREHLMSALTHHFESELDRSVARLNDGIAPYSRFVRAEQQNLAERRRDLSRARDELLRLKEEIEGNPVSPRPD